MNPIFGSALQMGLSPRSGLANAMAHANAQAQLANQAAFRNGLAQLQNAYPQMHNPEPAKERTPEEIQSQLEARYAEMEAEAERKAKAELTACSICRWSNGAWCRNPLVIGIEQREELNADYGVVQHSKLCGPEKALWEEPEPKRTIWQRIIDWFLEPWRDNLAQTNGKG